MPPLQGCWPQLALGWVRLNLRSSVVHKSAKRAAFIERAHISGERRTERILLQLMNVNALAKVNDAHALLTQHVIL
uniref:Uncharacterized protein n=1 Tax=Anguilla anguilla TaxID=7936 RepID=A0A0E9RK97_ANGAN